MPDQPDAFKTSFDSLGVVLLLLAFPTMLSLGFGPSRGLFATCAWLLFSALAVALLWTLGSLAAAWFHASPDQRTGFFSGHRWYWLITFILAAGAVRATAFYAPFDVLRHGASAATLGLIHPPAEGTFHAEGSSIGTWTQHVDACFSGQPNLYFGVRLKDTAQPQLSIKAVAAGTGSPHLDIDAPGKAYAVAFSQQDCAVLKVNLHQGASSYSGVRNIKGTVAFDCSSDQSHVWGQATLTNCH